MRGIALISAALALLAACGSSSFSLSGATVDGSYTCAVGSSNTSYNLGVKVSADNPTSKSVDVKSIDAVMVVSSIRGSWLQPVGTKYDAGNISFSPTSVGAGAKTTLTGTIPSGCTNGKHQGTTDNYADYSVQLTVVTSAGTFHLTSTNKHRIVAP